MQVIIIMPVYEDWESAIEVCHRIDAVLQQQDDIQASLLLIDDGSMSLTYPRQLPFAPTATERISVLVLRRNLGHQRAIAVGMTYLQQNRKADALVVMDADGEDRPEDIPLLIEAMRKTGRPTAVFAERGKRLENGFFRIFYQCYRILHRFLTGRDIRFGNFSLLPWLYLDRLVLYPELWNHYAATFIKSQLPYVRVRCNRSVRIHGKSHMNAVSLVIHGLSALFANQELVGTRLLVFHLLITLSLFFLAWTVVGVRLLTSLAIPGWATSTIGLLLVLVGQSLVASFILVFSVMMNRSQLGFLPVRDYSYFVSSEMTLYSR